jgi:hypothetical protein
MHKFDILLLVMVHPIFFSLPGLRLAPWFRSMFDVNSQILRGIGGLNTASIYEMSKGTGVIEVQKQSNDDMSTLLIRIVPYYSSLLLHGYFKISNLASLLCKYSSKQ